MAESLAGVPAADWNAVAGGDPAAAGDPFTSHEFLSALIDTGCASARAGWQPQIVLLERNGKLAAAMPLFLKTHSYGEYVFDWAWADAYQRHGLAYYPKLLCAVPFTPVTGPRLLAAQDADRRKLAVAALEMAREVSSLHVLFPPAAEARLMQGAGMMLRRTVQFHWNNDGYADFDDFLSRMTRHRRKNIRQERRRVHEAGVTFRWLRGAEIERTHWEFFERCYRRTYSAHRSSPYLNLEFFLRLGAALPRHTLLILAERAGKPVAATLNIVTEDKIFGRYWGARGACSPAPLRVLLLPGHRVRHRQPAAGLRGRRAGRAQAVPRPAAGRDALGALARPPALRARHRGLPAARKRRASRATWTN